mmetsp:Transcript_36227/g.117104  ORF Transcript_36227/g.117104 Transcript_36227/m.117104 type:complete len:245 (+) Transcript_36227:41-775(+)
MAPHARAEGKPQTSRSPLTHEPKTSHRHTRSPGPVRILGGRRSRPRSPAAPASRRSTAGTRSRGERQPPQRSRGQARRRRLPPPPSHQRLRARSCTPPRTACMLPRRRRRWETPIHRRAPRGGAGSGGALPARGPTELFRSGNGFGPCKLPRRRRRQQPERGHPSRALQGHGAPRRPRAPGTLRARSLHSGHCTRPCSRWVRLRPWRWGPSLFAGAAATCRISRRPELSGPETGCPRRAARPHP